MASQVDVKILRTLHRILKQQSELQSRRQQGPRKIQVALAAEKEFQKRVDEAKEQLRQTKIKADQKQLQLSEREYKIEDYKGKLNACESNREFQLLKEQIAADTQANSVLSDEILELLEKIDQLEATVDECESNLKKAQTDREQIKANVSDELAIVDRDLQQVTQELRETESRLPGDIKAEYQRMVSSVGEDALAPVEDSTCGHCCTVLTTQVVSELMLLNPVFCKSCGSLLYMPENAAV